MSRSGSPRGWRRASRRRASPTSPVPSSSACSSPAPIIALALFRSSWPPTCGRAQLARIVMAVLIALNVVGGVVTSSRAGRRACCRRSRWTSSLWLMFNLQSSAYILVDGRSRGARLPPDVIRTAAAAVLFALVAGSTPSVAAAAEAPDPRPARMGAPRCRRARSVRLDVSTVAAAGTRRGRRRQRRAPAPAQRHRLAHGGVGPALLPDWRAAGGSSSWTTLPGSPARRLLRSPSRHGRLDRRPDRRARPRAS